jgi:nucleotide-binding universal stress UspA family protein
MWLWPIAYAICTRCYNDNAGRPKMALKDILFLLENGDKSEQINAYALSFAQQCGAHLTAAGVIMEMIPPASFMGEYPADILAGIAEQTQRELEACYQRLKAAASREQETELVLIQAYPGLSRDEFGRLARHFDVTIVGQGPESLNDDELLAEGALFGSGRPVLVVPRSHKDPAKFGKAMIAYDGSAMSARAIADALPLLRKSGHVELVTIAHKDKAPNQLPGFNMTRHLARHGITAKLKELPPAVDVGASILSYAADMGADYLVMGAYGHSRLREFVIGGTTRTIINSMTLPVFMAH